MHPPRVFVAGQDVPLRGLIASVLRLDDHRIVEVAGLSELIDGVERVACAGDRDFAIVADADTGLDMLRVLRAAAWKTPVVLFTRTHKQARLARAAGATAVFRGFFTMASLRATVRQVMGHPPEEVHRRDAQEQRMGRRLRLLLTPKRRPVAARVRTIPTRRPSIAPPTPVALALTSAVGRR